MGRARIDRITHAAEGSWTELFARAGMDPAHFTRQNRPCPLCGGRDRFSLFTKEPGGRWFCRGCGSGDGIDLVRGFLNLEFPDALRWLEDALALPPWKAAGGEKQEKPEESAEERAARRRAELESLWSSAVPLSELDPESPLKKYLRRRGLDACVSSLELRYVPALPCWEVPEEGGRAELAGEFPAMIARVTGGSGDLVTLHRTYLNADGAKAPVRSAKKLAPGAVEDGLVRLYPASAVLCLAEGIETALSVHALTGLPAWSAISLTGLRRFENVPEGVRTVRICGDNDRSYAGAAGAYELAARLKRSRPELEVTVHIPPEAGTDWNDVLLAGGSLSF